MKTLSVKNFEKYQHYKDRTPPWIKLYNELLDDYEFGALDDASKWHLIAIWLLASRSDNRIPNDPEWISRRINAKAPLDLCKLIASGFLVENQSVHSAEHDASNALAFARSREGEKETEKETEEVRAEARSNGYAFEGKIIKLNPSDYGGWKQAFEYIELRAQLMARDAWLASPDATDDDRKRWFISTPRFLANENEKAKRARATHPERVIDPSASYGLDGRRLKVVQ